MELTFNEISEVPLCQNIHNSMQRMTTFSTLVSVFNKSHSAFTRIRSHKSISEIMLCEGYSISDWLHDGRVPQKEKEIFFGKIAQPFIDDEDERLVNKYISHSYQHELYDGRLVECLGITAAYLMDTLVVSLDSHEYWRNIRLPLIIEDENGTQRKESIYNVSLPEMLKNLDVKRFIESKADIQLIKSPIDPTKKLVHLTDHHGKNRLKMLSDRLIHCEYISSIISCEFGKSHSIFIDDVQEGGRIKIVLTDTDEKFALLVTTTGRNYRETYAIAEIINSDYS